MRTKPPKLWRISSQPRYVLLRFPKKSSGFRCSSIFLAAATPCCSLHLPRAALAAVPTSIPLHIQFRLVSQGIIPHFWRRCNYASEKRSIKNMLGQPISADPTYLIYQILGACVKTVEVDSAFYTKSFLRFLYSLPS